MGPFGRNFGNEYDRGFGRGEWSNGPGRWGFGGGQRYDSGQRYESQPMRGNQAYDRGFRDFGGNQGYDRGYRGDQHRGDQHLRQPFPTRPSHSMMPMSHNHAHGGYDVGYFGIDYDREMRGGGRGYGGGRYDRNFGDFRNSYLTGWF
jgi:hypothetical protein